MTRVKICGLTNLEDARQVVRCGADLVGFIFAESPRQVINEDVIRISKQLPVDTKKVGVFANQSAEEIKEVIANCSLDYIQLHGDETPTFCSQFDLPVIKAFRVKDKSSLNQLKEYQVDKYLLDTYLPDQLGGTGKTFNWELAKEAKRYGDIIVAGGLKPSNVAQVIKEINPWGIDVSSGVELEPGKKDQKKVREFIERAISCE
ncbi:phosphoribosylanthranilate isomerase [Halanaerocella petrolearia]